MNRRWLRLAAGGVLICVTVVVLLVLSKSRTQGSETNFSAPIFRLVPSGSYAVWEGNARFIRFQGDSTLGVIVVEPTDSTVAPPMQIHLVRFDLELDNAPYMGANRVSMSLTAKEKARVRHDADVLQSIVNRFEEYARRRQWTPDASVSVTELAKAGIFD